MNGDASRRFSTPIRKRLMRPWMRRPTGGTRRRVLVLLVILIGIVALLPAIVAKTALRNSVISAVVSTDRIRVTIGDASLGWFSPTSAAAVEVKDADGSPLFVAESLRHDRSLWSLLTNSRDLGMIEITRPTVYVTTTPVGSNIEDAVAELLTRLAAGDEDKPAKSSDDASTSIAVQVTDGSVIIEDAKTGRHWRMQGVNLQFSTTKDGAESFSFVGELSDEGLRDANGQVSASPSPAGRITASLTPSDDQGGRQRLTWQLDAVSLASAEPWLRRFIDGAELSGAVTGHGAAEWSTVVAAATRQIPGDLSTTGTLAIDGLDASAPALAGDRLRLARVELPWRVTARPAGLMPPGLAIEQLELRCDVGQVAVRGAIDTLAAAKSDVELRGAIDLARLAAILPHALRIRSDTTITGGVVQISARQQPAVGGGSHLSGSLQTSQLAATSGGRPVRWDEPISATFAVALAESGLRLDSLVCQSEFLAINAAGSPQQFAAAARFDLNRLAEKLGQFMNLSGVELAGSGTARVDWQLAGDTQFTASASGDLAAVRVALGDGSAWVEPQLAVRATSNGKIDATSGRLARLESARLEVAGQGDMLNASLDAPVEVAAADWPVTILASGNIARWLARVRPWVDMSGWQLDGQSELAAKLRVAKRTFAANGAKLVLTDVRANGPGWSIAEPRVELTGDALWNVETGELSSNVAELVSSTVSFAARDVRYGDTSQRGRNLNGAAAFRTDLARLAAWRSSGTVPFSPTAPSQPTSADEKRGLSSFSPGSPSIAYRPQGSIIGNLRFVQQENRITGELTATGENLALTAIQSPRSSANHPIWQESKLTVHATATYDLPSDRLTLDPFQIASGTLTAAMTGSVDNVSTDAQANFSGTLDYDLDQVTPLLRPYLGSGVSLTGREQARFALAGRLGDVRPTVAAIPASLALDSRLSTLDSVHWSRRVQARVELPWSGATVYGLPIGSGKLAAAVADGTVRVEPFVLTVSQGRLTVAPSLRLDPAPMELVLPAGPLLTDVRITPEVSEAMLKYVAPVLAGATQTEGQFSMHLEGARVPIGETRKPDVAGRLDVRSLRVVPGPLANEFISMSRQIEAIAKQRDPTTHAQRQQITLLAIRDQPVNFRLIDGRVHHQSLEFQVDEVVLRTQGSVGLDETLQLTLFVPIQDRWIENTPILAGLKGKELQVPVTGTLGRPRLDQSAAANLSAQLLQSAAGSALQGELNKALDRLFKPREQE